MTALLTARAVADTLGVSSETVLRWTRRGDLPAIRLPGGAIRYRTCELEQWLDARATNEPKNEAEPGGQTGPGRKDVGDDSASGPRAGS